ncbi:uncharacterized protein [Nicotiana sylvestris]|uniref:uncharacterized protein n=1 Tax=Nicotiana sylvestris TaxID=4096 RepID=UPI00388C3976
MDVFAGLHSGIKDTMAPEVEMGTSCELVVEIVRRIKCVRQWSQEQVPRDKRFCYFGEFSGAPSWGRGYTYSYVSTLFAHFLGVPHESLGTPVYVSTQVGNSIVVDLIYPSCIVTFCGYETRVDLLLLDMTDFEIILGMDWLSPYHAILDFHAKTVTLAMPEFPRLEWRGSSVSASSWVISFLKAQRMVKKGCLAYLAYVRNTTTETPMIDSVPMVREFFDVFPSNLPSMPPDRDIDLCIDLALGTQYISFLPYRMAPKKLKKLKK